MLALGPRLAYFNSLVLFQFLQGNLKSFQCTVSPFHLSVNPLRQVSFPLYVSRVALGRKRVKVTSKAFSFHPHSLIQRTHPSSSLPSPQNRYLFLVLKCQRLRELHKSTLVHFSLIILQISLLPPFLLHLPQYFSLLYTPFYSFPNSTALILFKSQTSRVENVLPNSASSISLLLAV